MKTATTLLALTGVAYGALSLGPPLSCRTAHGVVGRRQPSRCHPKGDCRPAARSTATPSRASSPASTAISKN